MSSETPAIPLEWVVPPDLSSRYATDMFVQRGAQEITLWFLEVRGPIVTPMTSDFKQEGTPSAQVECVARVVVSLNRIHEFVTALQSVLPEQQQTPTEVPE
jgi:hypothetical protein